MKNFYNSIFYVSYKINKFLNFGIKIWAVFGAAGFIPFISIVTIFYTLLRIFGEKYFVTFQVLITFCAVLFISQNSSVIYFAYHSRYLKIEKYFDENKQRRVQAVKNYVIYLLIHIVICLFAYLFGTQ